MRSRMDGHRAAYRSGKNMPLYKHLRKPNHSFADLSVTILETFKNPSQKELLDAEALWMNELETKIPKGLNSLYS